MTILITELVNIGKMIQQENDLGKVYELIFEAKKKCNDSPSAPDKKDEEAIIVVFGTAMGKCEDFLID